MLYMLGYTHIIQYTHLLIRLCSNMILFIFMNTKNTYNVTTDILWSFNFPSYMIYYINFMCFIMSLILSCWFFILHSVSCCWRFVMELNIKMRNKCWWIFWDWESEALILVQFDINLLKSGLGTRVYPRYPRNFCQLKTFGQLLWYNRFRFNWIRSALSSIHWVADTLSHYYRSIIAELLSIWLLKFPMIPYFKLVIWWL